MEQPPRRTKGQNPMHEENFPTHSPTRDAVERDMREPSNLRGPAQPPPQRRPPLKEAGDGLGGDPEVQQDAADE